MTRCLRATAAVVAALIPMAAALSGCATIVTQGRQGVTIKTDPDGAECQLTRAGVPIAHAKPTPSVIEVSSSYAPIEVTCNKNGHFETKSLMEAGINPLILGNFITGGILGIIIDFATGSASTYPDRTEITLVPDTFPTTAARDQFFEYQLKRIDGRVDQAIADAKIECASSDSLACGPDLDELKRDVAADRARLLSFRDKVRIASGPVPTLPMTSSAMSNMTAGGHAGVQSGHMGAAQPQPALTTTVQRLAQRVSGPVFRTERRRSGFYGP